MSEKLIAIGDNDLVPTLLSFNMSDAMTTPVRKMSLGHSHLNDYSLPTEESAEGASRIYLAYGRHTGYGGYGDLHRGARMFNARIYYSAPNGILLETWVRMEDGRVPNKMVV